MDKRDLAAAFRDRLQQLLAEERGRRSTAGSRN